MEVRVFKRNFKNFKWIKKHLSNSAVVNECRIMQIEENILLDLHSGEPWLRKFGNLCIQEILVLRKSSVGGTSVCASTLSCKPGRNFAFQGPARFGGKSQGFPAY